MNKSSGMIEDRASVFKKAGTASAGNSPHAAAADHVHPKQTADDGVFEIVDVPAGDAPTGKKGQVAFDTDYLYICVATDTWKKVELEALA